MATFPVSAKRWRQQTDHATLKGHASISAILAVIFQLFAWLTRWKLKLHRTAERETISLKLWLQWDILRVKAIFVCKGDSFTKSVLSSKWPKSSTLSLIITPSDKYIKIRSNLVWSIEMFKNLHSVNCQYIERLKCHLLISIQTLHISTTVLHTKILYYARVIRNGGGVLP